jgi:hypothetical protein
MKKTKKQWIISIPKQNPTNAEKERINAAFTYIIDGFKKSCISESPDKNNYLIDIYATWYRNYFYLCEKFKSESPNRMVDEFETKFVRLEYKGKDSFDFSYFRHTGAWHLVAQSLSLEDCKELILSNPNFQPIPF